MSNTENNKNEQFDHIKEIPQFVTDKVRPLVDNIRGTKQRLEGIMSMLTEKKNALRTSEEAVESDDKIIETEATESAPIAEPVAAETLPEKKEEEKTSPAEEPKEVKEQPKKPLFDKPNFENARVDSRGDRPPYREGAGANRPQGDRRPPYNNGAAGRPSGPPSGGRFGNNAQAPRFGDKRPPFGQGAAAGPRGGFGAPKFAPVEPPKDTKKKKVVTEKKNDDTKKLNKRAMIKKGYIADDVNIDSALDEHGVVKHFKVKKKKQEFIQPISTVIDHAVVNSEIIPIKTLSEKIGKTAPEIVKKLFLIGQMTTVNGTIDFETAELIAMDYGVTLELQKTETAEDKLNTLIEVNTASENLVKRPPIVTIMGHVDHGKTSLLDFIRKTHVTSGEAGGITQHIGAYTIAVNGEQITFLDTPGHEAFTSMRKRGAQVTDIAIIVVAADDGIMPQTQEAISHAKDAGVSIMVAINKMDKPEANADKVKQQLTNYELVPEEWGGDVICCPVSAKTGMGVSELLENIILLADMKELKADPTLSAQGTIIEARLDKGTGPVASVLVQNGTLKVADFVVAGTSIGKVRAMVDDKGNRLKEAGPSVAVSVLGFSEVPNAGDQMIVVKDEKLAKQVAAERAKTEREQMQKISSKKNLEDMFKNMQEGEKKVLPVIIKGDVQGSVEAVRQALEKLSDEMSEDGVKITVPLCGVGAVNESDAMLAETSNAVIIAFNVRPDPKAKAYAEQNNIDIKYFRIIYDLIETVKKAMTGMLEPTFKEIILGHAEVREVFNITGVGTIAGSYVTDGKVMRNAKVRFLRENIVIYEGSISSLKRMKDDVKEVAAGYECGIGLEGISDIKIGDTMEAFVMELVERK